jgi:phage shock protein A
MEKIDKMMDIMMQVQQSVLELRDDVNVIKTDVADLKVRVTNIEERVTNIEENMVRRSDLKYYDFKIAEHDREIFQLKQQN